MPEFFRTHPKTRWTTITLGALLLVIVLLLAFFDWNLLRPMVAHMISTRTGRPVTITGDLRVHPWSFTPSAEVDGLSVGNPDWAKQPVMLGARSLMLSISLGRLLRGQLVLPRIEVREPSIDLERDAQGRASWEFGNQGAAQNTGHAPPKLPTIRRLLIEQGHLRVTDAIRKLALEGTLEAHDEGARTQGSAFSLECTGSLNAKPFRAHLRGGPLIDLDPDHPYDLQADLRASDIMLDAHITFPKPFDLGAVRARFDLAGGDLADVYYLTGLALPNTPPYHLTGSLRAEGTVYRMDDLKGRLGSSDLEGEMRIETSAERPKLTARLHSSTLNLVDVAPTLGHPVAASGEQRSSGAPPASARPTPRRSAATHKTEPSQPATGDSGHLFPDAQLQIERVRGMDADVVYNAAAVTAPKLPMKQVSFHLLLDAGLLKIDPLSFTLSMGRFAGGVRIDARKDTPQTTLAMSIDQIDLSQFKSAQQTQGPLQGSLVGRVQVHGTGGSIHDLASTASGGISVALPAGQLNEAIAELVGIDVARGLGLLLSKPEQKTAIRCGVADFQATDGVLNSRAVFVDTNDVVVTGRGQVNLGSEHLDLELQGHPKKFRILRLHTPITITGTLLHPVIGVKPQRLLAQAGVAAALSALLTPVAAALAFIDPGLAKNKDCAAVLAEAHTDQAPTPSSPPAGTPQPGVGASEPAKHGPTPK